MRHSLNTFDCPFLRNSFFLFFVFCIFCLCAQNANFFLICCHFSGVSKIIISGIPQNTNFDDIEPLLRKYGKVEHCDAVSSTDPNTQTVHITFETPDQAQR